MDNLTLLSFDTCCACVHSFILLITFLYYVDYFYVVEDIKMYVKVKKYDCI